MKKTALLLINFFLFQFAYSQNVQVNGNIKSEEGETLPGVTVLVKGTNVGTISDFDGNFSIDIDKGQTLVFSYIGFKTIEKVVKTETVLNILMESDTQMLDEVVAIGYGTMKKSDLTGAVASVSAQDLQKTPASGLDQALQGRAAGVTVNANSGQPGAAAEVRIRGIGTVNNSAPIYVVDGVIVDDISFLSPSDIESTEILKDASSTAIYGSRGANGVILVTTKKGSSEGRINVSLNAYVGFQNRWNKLDLMKSKEFAETLIDLNNVASEKKYYEENGFNEWLKAYRLGNSEYYPSNLDYSTIETDWQDEVFRKNAIIQNYHVSVDGGNEKSNFSMSGSYFTQDGTIIGSDYNRVTLRVNSSHKVNKWLKVGENLSFMSSYGRNAMNNNSSPGASILSAAIAMAPWDPTHYPEGSVNSAGKDLSGQISAASNFKNVVNPYSMVYNSEPSDKTERWVGDLYLELTPIKGLVFRSDVSLDLTNIRSREFKYAYEYSAYDKAEKNFISSSMSRASNVIVENILTYSKEIGKHSFSIMGGQTTEEYNYYSIGGSGSSILNPVESNWYLSQATEDQVKASDSASRVRRFSLLSRLHYGYNNKYLITVNFRADASSKFKENIWGYFPSTALAWRISEEDWMKKFSFLSDLKLRAGWGQIGNDQISNDSFVLSMFNSGPTFVDYVLGQNQALASGATILTYVNNGGKWETTEQLNFGLDFGFMNNKLVGTIDVFRRDTKDMLLSVTAPAHVGNRYAAVANVGTVRNQGLELTLNYRNKISEVDFSIGGNASFIKNELTALNGGSRIYGDRTICDEGLALYTFWGYNYEGIYKTDEEALEHLYSYKDNPSSIPFHAGDAKYTDINGDGKIDDNDKTDLGNPFPWLTYGINLGAEWKGFDCQLFFQGVYGNKIFNAVRIRTEGTGNEATLSTTMRDVWTESNPNGSIPNPYGSTYNKEDNSRYIENGAYLRLKNFQIGYTLPVKVVKKANISNCRLYISVNNLLTFTHYTGYDPEISGGVDYGNYPQSRTFTIGANINF